MPFIPWLGQQCNDIRVQTVNMYIYIHYECVCALMCICMEKERSKSTYTLQRAMYARIHIHSDERNHAYVNTLSREYP